MKPLHALIGKHNIKNTSTSFYEVKNPTYKDIEDGMILIINSYLDDKKLDKYLTISKENLSSWLKMGINSVYLKPGEIFFIRYDDSATYKFGFTLLSNYNRSFPYSNAVDGVKIHKVYKMSVDTTQIKEPKDLKNILDLVE